MGRMAIASFPAAAALASIPSSRPTSRFSTSSSFATITRSEIGGKDASGAAATARALFEAPERLILLKASSESTAGMPAMMGMTSEVSSGAN